MEDIRKYVESKAQRSLLSTIAETQAVVKFNVSFKDVELIALDLKILPARYQMNRSIFSTEDQLTLLKSHVAIVGCGRLGTCMIEQMARLGIGKITIFDPDDFEGRCFNHHTGLDCRMIGEPKVNVAKAIVKDVNPAVEVIPVQGVFDKGIDLKNLDHIHVAIDTVDTFQTRIDLADACCNIGAMVINGAISRWFDYDSATRIPGNPVTKISYKDSEAKHEVERTIGNSSNIPVVIVSFQLAEVCKIILKKRVWPKQKLFVDLQIMEIERIWGNSSDTPCSM